MAYYDFQEPADNSLFGNIVNTYVPDWLTGNNKKLEVSRGALAAKNNLKLNQWSDYRAMKDVWTDPLFLNFRLMINYSKPYGLFAAPGPDKNTDNSAVSYLRRIGEESRADLLEKWIEVFKNFIREHDYMIMSCEGLSEIFNHKQGEIYTDADKISFGIREAVDMRFQSLLTMYRNIWFDDDRGVEILPINLRRFDIMVIVYSAGYFNMDLYDVTDAQKSETDLSAEITLPTIRKIIDAWQYGSNISKYNFNSTLFYIGDCSIDLENSGKTFFENIVNDASAEQTKNNLSLNFRFAWVSGTYNNTFGKLDISRVLAIAAAADKANGIKGILGDYAKSLIKETKAVGENYLEELKSKPSKWFNALLGEQSFIGNALSTITDPKYLTNMVKNTVDLGITTIENKFVYSNIDSLQKIVKDNFSFRFIDIYNKYLMPGPKVNEVKHDTNMSTDGIGIASERTDIQKSSYIPDSIPITSTFKYQKDIDNGLGNVEDKNIQLSDSKTNDSSGKNQAVYNDTITDSNSDNINNGIQYQTIIAPISENPIHRNSILKRNSF